MSTYTIYIAEVLNRDSADETLSTVAAFEIDLSREGLDELIKAISYMIRGSKDDPYTSKGGKP